MLIKIFQINTDRDTNRIAFESFYNMQRYSGNTKVDVSIYDKVFDGSVVCKDLEDVYHLFNVKHPVGYTGRSLSMSDVVEVVDSSDVSSVDKGFYYCDRFGFKKIDFSPEKSLDEIIAKCDAQKTQPGKSEQIGKTTKNIDV